MSTYLSISATAAALKISVQRVRTLCRNGNLAAQKIGSSWIIDPLSVTHYGLKTAHMLAHDHPAQQRQSGKPIALSFFSGAMGLDLGLEKAGFDIRLACESDKYCRQTIALNRPDTALLGDINSCSAEQVLEAAGIGRDDVDVIVGTTLPSLQHGRQTQGVQ